MTNCLGIYFDDNIVKYAKLIKNNTGTIEIKEHGIRFVKPSLKETIEKVISDTNSDKDVPIVINAPKIEYNGFQVFKQISNNDLQSIIKLEFEDWCEKKTQPSDKYSFVYQLSTTIVGDYYKGMMAIASKESMDIYSRFNESKTVGVYPTELLLPTDIPDDEKNCLLINLDKKLIVTTVINAKSANNSIYDTGMQQIFDKFIDVLGSYQKAYEACKQLNVFSDADSDTNKRQLEEIVEPILQEILKNVAEDISKYKDNITKLFITGTGTLFTNIDTLFTEYFGIRCEILKPKFVTDVGGVRNIAETLEVLPAIALAKEYLAPATTGLEFLKVSVAKESFIQKAFAKKKVTEVKDKTKDEKKLNKLTASLEPGFIAAKLSEFLMYPIIVCGLAVITYLVFTNIYINQINRMNSDVSGKIKKYEDMARLAKSDKSTIETATNQYKAINDQVDQIKQQIESNQIGKFSTYNVAAFTQKLIKVIPKNVQLKTISSDDNKKIKIVAQSDAYPNLGYFVANLRLNPDILTNVTVTNVTNGSIVTIEIGGDLP